MVLIDRPRYLEAINPYIDQPVVKVLTGLRRSGKSSIMALLAERLERRSGATVIRLDFDNFELADLATARALHDHLSGLLPEGKKAYLLLDEIQEVDGWEKVVNSLHASGKADIYLTGSNSRLLSSELSTYIAGRFVTIPVSTLSFAEHVSFTNATTDAELPIADHFNSYLRRGGFPGLTQLTSYPDTETYRAIRDIYGSALIRDVITRNNIRNADMLQRIAAFAMENTGYLLSGNSIANYFKSQRRKVDPETVLSYLSALSESFILYRVPRFDLQGRELLTVNDKYFAGDHGLIHALLGYQDRHLPGVLENIVFHELLRRGFQVYVGKLGDREIDFITETDGKRYYIQVTTSLDASPQTRARELAPLLAIKDSYPKLILSLDQHAGGSENGIEHRWLPDWLLQT
jgi:predicted AAA+ superfamily ATPase